MIEGVDFFTALTTDIQTVNFNIFIRNLKKKSKTRMTYQVNQKSIFYQSEYNQSNSNLVYVSLECPSDEFTYVIVSNNTDNSQTTINQLSSQVSSSEDVENLLDHVNWRMFVYLCGKTCQNFTYSTYEIQEDRPNSTGCFSDSTDDIYRSSARCGNSNCTNAVNSHSGGKWFVFLIAGLICLFGNSAVILDKIISLRKKQHKDKEIQIYHTLVLNLALTDLLMGIYLTAIGFEIKHKASINIFYSESRLCNALGIIRIVSNQVSITILFIISFYRLIGVIKPYKSLHYKFIVILVTLTWIIWLVVAATPLIPFIPLKSVFTFGFVKDRQIHRDSVIDFAKLASFIKKKMLPSFINVPEVKSVYQNVIQFPTSSVFEKFSASLGWIGFKPANWKLVGFYDSKYFCSPDFLVENDEIRLRDYFDLTLLFYNFAISVAIMIAYVLVTINISNKSCSEMFVADCKWFLGNFCCTCEELGHSDAARLAENRQMFRRISIIILTDVACWVPVCVMSIVDWQFPPTNTEGLSSRSLSFHTIIITLVPLNSMLNPFIYSFHLWKLLFKHIKSKF